MLAAGTNGYSSPAFCDPTVFIVNTDLAGDTEINGFEDLLNPEVKGRIASGDPVNSSSAFQCLIAGLYDMGNGDHQKFRQPVHCSAVGSFCAAGRATLKENRQFFKGLSGADGADPPTGHTDSVAFFQKGLLPVIQLFKRFSDSFSLDAVP